MLKKTTITAIALLTAVIISQQANAASTGIGALIQVTQLKSQFANEEALRGAEKQRDLVANKTKKLKAISSSRRKTPLRKFQNNRGLRN